MQGNGFANFTPELTICKVTYMQVCHVTCEPTFSQLGGTRQHPHTIFGVEQLNALIRP